MRRTVLWAAALPIAFTMPGGLSHAQQQPATVYLNLSRDWHVASGKQPWVHILARELTRQAFLLAARDEMGLVTRDAWLGDARSPQDDSLAFDINTTPGNPLILEVVRGLPPQQVGLVRHELRRSGSINYRTWTVEVEALSRTKFVEALKQAGFQGQPSKRDEGLAVPENVELLLGEMNLFSQFQALRELHATIRNQGESAALLGGLVRGYANLGVMTEYYWHAAHKIFKARALLYAQRMVVREEESAVARWHRAYAAALTGLHAWGLADLEEADQRWRALAEADRPVQPVWAQLIGPFCRYEIDALAEHVKDAKCKELAALLRYLAVEQANYDIWGLRSMIESAKALPECFRVYDGIGECSSMVARNWATSEPIKPVVDKLYGRVQSMPGLPAEVRRILNEQALRGGLLGALFGSKPAGGENEFNVRRQLTDALLRSGGRSVAETDDAKDQTAAGFGEPSWAALGTLIRELSFKQGYLGHRSSRFTKDGASFLTAALPLIEGHPCRAVLGASARDVGNVEAARDASAEVAKLDVVGFAYPVRAFSAAIRDQRAREEVVGKLSWNGDDMTVDLTLTIRGYVEQGRNPDKVLLDTLLKISPHSPMARTLLVRYHWDSVSEAADDWAKVAAPFPGLLVDLAYRYTSVGRLDDAERCLKDAIKRTSVNYPLYQQLAEIYLKRGQTDLWLATLEESLRQPGSEVASAPVRIEIAQHYMRHKQWEKALPYAKAALEKYQGFGPSRQRLIQTIAQCNEGLQRWEEAETHYRQCGEIRPADFRQALLTVWPQFATSWYYFCRRTGQGDLEGARNSARAFVDSLMAEKVGYGPNQIAVFYLLEEQPAKALGAIGVVPRDPRNAIWGAVVADQLKDFKKRDEALNRAKAAVAANTGGEPSPQLKAWAALADLIVKDLAQGGEGKIDLAATGKLSAVLGGEERLQFDYFLGQYLNLHGQREQADRCWKRCMAQPVELDSLHRTLAGAALLQHDITPADYKALLQPDTGEGQKTESED